MVLQQMGETAQQTKDALGPRDTTRDPILFRNREFIRVEEGPLIVQNRTIGTAFILGHPTNGILGTSTLGQGTLGSWTTRRITNPNNVFHEHFRDSFFNDTANTTASWDTTNFRVEFATDRELFTGSIFLNSEEVAQVKPTLNSSGLRVTFQIDSDANPGGVEVNLT